MNTRSVLPRRFLLISYAVIAVVEKTSARNLKDPFLRGFANTEQNIGETVCLGG